MTCRELDRWMDEGMPERDSDSAHAHARTCARCAAALETERSIASAFRAAGTSIRAPQGFASRVMSRVSAAEAAATHPFVQRPSPPWWIALVTDPVACVPLTVALLALALLIWNPAVMARAGAWIGGRWFAWIALACNVPLDPRVWIALVATACPFVIWWIWTVGRSVERSLVVYLVRSRH